MTKTSKLLASILAAFLLIFLASLLLRSHHSATPHIASLDETAAAVAQNGEMSKQDYLNFERIEVSAERRGLITEEDLDWILNLLRTSTKSDNPDAPELRRLDVAIILRNVKNLTPAQEDRVYHAVSVLLASSNKSDKIGAIAVMKNIKDRRALPTLTHLLEDNDPTVQSLARKAIQAINS